MSSQAFRARGGFLSAAMGVPEVASNPPSAPRNLSWVEIGTTEIDLAWATPLAVHKSPIAAYLVTVSGGSGTCEIDGQTVSFTSGVATQQVTGLGCQITDLATATTYTMQVQALNGKGAGAAATVVASTYSPDDAPWDPSQPDVFDSIVGPAVPDSEMTFLAVGSVPAFTGVALRANPLVGPAQALRTGNDADGNALVDQVKLDQSLNFVQGDTSFNDLAFHTTITDSVLNVCVEGGDSGVKCVRCLIKPTIAASQAAGGGATSSQVSMLQCDVQMITDGFDPTGDGIAIYTRFSGQLPLATDGLLFNAQMPFFYNVGGKWVNGNYQAVAAKNLTDATASTGATSISTALVVYGDGPYTSGAPASRPVVGTNIPPNTFVGAVTGVTAQNPGANSKGTGFTLVDYQGNAVQTTGPVSGCTFPAFGPTRTDTVSAASGASAVSDTSITTWDAGRVITAINGATSYGYGVGTVTAGASFNLVDSTGAPTTAPETISSVTLGTWMYGSEQEGYNAVQYPTLLGTTVTVGTMAKLEMKGGNTADNNYLFECVVGGTADGTAYPSIAGACTQSYWEYFGVPNHGVPNPIETGCFWTVINGQATNVPFSLNSDGSINMAALATSAAGRAVWCTLGKFMHADGIQTIQGDGLFVDHCIFENVVDQVFFLEPVTTAEQVVSNAHCRKSMLYGGSLKWVDIENHNGPLNFAPGSPAGGVYWDPASGNYKCYVQNRVLTDTTGASGKEGQQVVTNINGTRPRGARIVENWFGPLINGNYPTCLSSATNGMIWNNAGQMVGSDAQYLKCVNSQYNNVLSADGLTLSTPLTAGTPVTSVTVTNSSGNAIALNPYDVIFVVAAQDGGGQSTSQWFVVGPDAVTVAASGSTTINVQGTEGVGVNTGTFPCINTTPDDSYPAGTTVYTPYSDLGAILDSSFSWLKFDRVLNSVCMSTYGQTIPVGTTSFPIDFLPEGYTPKAGDQIMLESITPTGSASTPQPTETLTLTGTYTNASTTLTTTSGTTQTFEGKAIVNLLSAVPKWNGQSLTLNQTVLKQRYNGPNASGNLTSAGCADARTMVRVWGNVPTGGPNAYEELLDVRYIGDANFDQKGLYVGP